MTDVIKAAIKTKQLTLDSPTFPLAPAELSRRHTLQTLDGIITLKVTGEKAHRHLGWAQAALVNAGGATLEGMKEINRES